MLDLKKRKIVLLDTEKYFWAWVIEMGTGTFQTYFRFTLPWRDRNPNVQRAIAHQNRGLLAICLTSGFLAIATAASAQGAGQLLAQDLVQHSTCTADTQGLMCPAGDSLSAAMSSTNAMLTPPIAVTGAAHSLSPAQMELIANILLGLLYFVLPAGLGLSIFLHERYQAYRNATLEAQIKLLEKLWEQSPQS